MRPRGDNDNDDRQKALVEKADAYDCAGGAVVSRALASLAAGGAQGAQERAAPLRARAGRRAEGQSRPSRFAPTGRRSERHQAAVEPLDVGEVNLMLS